MDGETVAVFGQLHPEQAASRKLRQEVYLAEVMLDQLYKHSLREPRYQRISKFPAVGRDFSFVFDDAVTFEKIRSAVGSQDIAELTAFAPGEIYPRRESWSRQVLRSASLGVPVEGADPAGR